MAISHVASTPVFVTGNAARTVSPAASTVAGDAMLLVVAFQDSAATTITTPSGWTVVKDAVQTGTLKTSIFTRTFQAGDTTWSYTPSGSVETAHVVLTVKGADASSWVFGDDGTRAASGGAAATTAPALVTTQPSVRAFVIATDRTTADETVEASANNSFTKVLHAFSNGSSAESIFIGYRDIASPATVGATTVTFQNSQASNGYAVLATVPTSGVYTGTFAAAVSAVAQIGSVQHLQVFSAQVTSPPSNPRLRVFSARSDGTQSSIPKLRVFSAALSGSPRVALDPIADRTEPPERVVTLVAKLQGGGFADSYLWRRVSGVGVTLAALDDTATLTVPSIVTPGAVQIGCTAVVNGIQSTEVVSTITIIPQTVFSRVAGRPWSGALTP